jgi:hypothetical protein
MVITRTLVPLASACLLFAGVAAAQQEKPAREPLTAAEVDKMMTGWPAASREAVKFMTEKYRAPDAMTKDLAIWGETGPWKRTVVFRQEIPHEFPRQHTDVMQQWVDLKVPLDAYDEMARYDGSVVLERTSGEASARCDKEAANFLALILAHELATGKRSVDDARKTYAEQIEALMAKRPSRFQPWQRLGHQP